MVSRISLIHKAQLYIHPPISSLMDTTVVYAIFDHFDIFIPAESSLHHRASNDALIFVVLQINILLLNKMQMS